MSRPISVQSALVGVTLFVGLGLGQARAAIDGITGPNFQLTAKEDYISTADGGSLTAWGYANGGAVMQYPGPTLIVQQGDLVTITLRNQFPAHGADAPLPVSIVFPGQQGVVASGGLPGLLTREAAVADDPNTVGDESVVTYTFLATQPGTFIYHSGTRPDLQVEMGLVGALIVRPAVPMPDGQAYGHTDSAFDREYLFLLTEMDPAIHDLIAAGRRAEIDTTGYRPVLWFINGRTAPDVMLDAFVPWLPTQPYNAMPVMHPGERVLMRIVNGGRDLHPFHHHGNNATVIARDGRLLESAPGAGADLAVSNFTISAAPGATYDAIFEWTGKALGWDIYGHAPGDPLAPNEYAPDHGKPLPVSLPNPLELTNGQFWSGSPYLGSFGVLPPGGGGNNFDAAYFFMWHSHHEKEMTNNDIFPGGMMTMLIVAPPDAPMSH